MSRTLRALAATVVMTGVFVAAPAQAASFGISSLSATSGPLPGGARISLHGNGFAHVTKVLFGGAAGHSVRVTSTHLLSVVVPSHKAGRVDVRVVISTGTTALVKADRFTYVAPPTVTALTTVGSRVTVKGKNFSHVKAVLFGKTKGTKVHAVSTTTLLVTVPIHSPGTVDVHVQTAYGTSKSVKADHFTYAAPIVGQPVVTPTAAPSPTPTPAPPLVIAAATLPTVVTSLPYAGATLTASGGVPPYHWSATGLPNGLTLSAEGALSGSTLASAGPRRVTATVTDSVGVLQSKEFPLSVVARAGQLNAFGYNDNGQVGDGTTGAAVTSPYAVPGLSNVVSVAGSRVNGWAATTDGKVWAWGANAQGQLGDGTTTPQSKPQQVPGLSNVVAVAAGTLAAYALTSDGTVFAWGLGTGGQLGNGGGTSSSPVQVARATDIVSIAAGDFVAYAVRSDGTVLTWGSDEYGQLGDGGTMGQGLAIAVPGLHDVVSIAAGMNDAFALHADGTVSAWGRADGGQLGLGNGSVFQQGTPVTIPGLTGITQIAAGPTNAYAVSADGSVWAWGDNAFGAAGTGDFSAVRSPVTLPGIAGAAAVSAFEYGGFAMLADGTVKEWGDDHYGELGDGTAAITKLTAVTAPWSTNTLAIALSTQSITNYIVKATKHALPPPIGNPPPVK